MRKSGKIIAFTPYEEMKDKDGQTVTSKWDGLAVMKRQVVVDCSYISENGEDVTDSYVCDMYRDIDDARLKQYVDSREKLALYISANFYQNVDGKYYQRITLKNIREIND